MAKILIGSYSSKREAETTVKKLVDKGYALGRFSIASGDYVTEEKALRFYNTGDRVRRWAAWAALWGFIFGLFLGPIITHTPVGTNLPGIIHLPELGHYFSLHVYATPLGWLLGAGATAVFWSAFAALFSWIFSIGTPPNSVIEYDVSQRAQRVDLFADAEEESERMKQNLEGRASVPESVS